MNMLEKKSNFDPERLRSAKQLKADEGFEPYPVSTGDELYPNGIFEFNISKIIKDVENDPDKFGLCEIFVGDFPGGLSTINEAHLESVDISRPVILAEISPGRYNVIDGNHRMEKARRLKMNAISAYQLDVTQHLKYLTSKKAYFAYIRYWNEKVQQIRSQNRK